MMSMGEPLGLTGCNRLTFEPSISVDAGWAGGRARPTGLTVGIHVPQTAGSEPDRGCAGEREEYDSSLPAGVGLNPAGADGLSSCGEGEVGCLSRRSRSCPESSKVGTVEIKTPLLPNPLVGAVYLADQNANPFGSLLALYIVARDPVSGVLVKLAGEVKPDPVTGQLVRRSRKRRSCPSKTCTSTFSVARGRRWERRRCAGAIRQLRQSNRGRGPNRSTRHRNSESRVGRMTPRALIRCRSSRR